jgi:hypothetical protein
MVDCPPKLRHRKEAHCSNEKENGCAEERGLAAEDALDARV